jgi:hypothetical protein
MFYLIHKYTFLFIFYYTFLFFFVVFVIRIFYNMLYILYTLIVYC